MKKSITEYAFNQWANSPKSGHAKDMERFYEFVKTMKRYRNKKYLSKEYFKQELENGNGNALSDDEIDFFFNRMNSLLEYEKYQAYSLYDFNKMNFKN